MSFWQQFPRQGQRVTVRAAAPLLLIEHGGQPVGEAEVRIEDTTLFIERVEVVAHARGHGLGADAVGAIFAAAGDAGLTRIRAWAPPGLGLAVYFWFRMGLHPLHGPGPSGGIWLEKDSR